MVIYDLSMIIKDKMPTYPGDPTVSLKRFLTHTKNGCNVLSLQMGTHSSTHVDLPLHHIEEGKDAVKFPIDQFIGEAVILRIPKRKNQAITRGDLEKNEIRKDDIVIISTGWEEKVTTSEFFRNFPFFDEEVACFFIQRGVKAVGCDMPSVDDVRGSIPVHHQLLGAGIGIIEGLINLELLCGKRLFFIGLPLRIAGGDGSPIRAIALLEEEM